MKTRILLVVLLAFSLIIIGNANAAETCVSGVNNLSLTCDGGAITQDAKSGCRTIICANGDNSIKVQACDKPDLGTKTHFEMSRQSATGTPPKVCLSKTCMQSQTFLRGETYPICTQDTTNPPANNTNSTPTNNNQTCYNSLKTVPASCTGSSITQDTISGSGRTVVCGATKVQAWEKTGYFEMYKQSGDNSVKVCLANACIQSSGFARSTNYPICMNSQNNTNPTNNTNTTNPGSDPGASSSLNLVSGTINNQAVSSSSRTIVVAPGSSITGQVSLNSQSAWPSTISRPLISTPNWGNHESSYVWHGNATSKTVPINFIAPATSGTYYIIFAYRGEVDGGDVASMTNWATNPEVWNDGNDVADWNESMINTANSNGRVLANVLFDAGMKQQYVPATAIKIVVDGLQNTTLKIHSGNINGQTLSNTQREITVQPGQTISGTLNLAYTSEWHPGAVIKLSGTSSWGDNSASFKDHGHLPTPASGVQTVNVNYIAPATPGTYNIIFAYMPTYTDAEVMSMTHYEIGSPVWNDGNDIADWSQSKITETNTKGWTYENRLRSGNKYEQWHVASTAIKVNVAQSTNNNTNQTINFTGDPGNISSLFIKSGTLNNQEITKSRPFIGINSQETVSGTVTVDYDNKWPVGTKVVMITTTNWGDRRTSCEYVDTVSSGEGSKTVPISVDPPATPGIYRVWIAFRAELDEHDVCSSTSWNSTNPEVYGDWNDIANWEQSEYYEAQTSGRVLEEIYFGDHHKRLSVPAAVININVKSDTQSASSLAQGLHSYFHMNNELGDDVGGHNGMIIKPAVSFTTGKIGQAADFSADSAVQSRHYMQNTPQSTFAFWANFDGEDGAVWSWPGRFEILRIDDRVELRSIPRNPSVMYIASSKQPIVDGEWHHYTFVINDNYPANIVDFYIDGVYQGSVNVPETGAQPYMSLGSPTDRVYTGFSSEGFEGKIDEMGVWARMLSEQEIKTLYNNSAGNVYPFGTGAPIYSSCYAQMQDIPAICEGGSIISDVNSADTCRYVTCQSGSSNLSIKVCNKPGYYTPSYFEIYKQNYTGTAPLKICLQGTCFKQTDSFMRSPNYPICTQ
ncbi:MAG TPA: LamG-like jellyroll fold domain-containing protein [Alphaproteobacteria bacterium]|nr:LamG-like jellyroll fold domain-containing protein [Alphaproteobacteria bacterium]